MTLPNYISECLHSFPLLCSKVFRIHAEGRKTKRKRLANGKLSSNPPVKPALYLQFIKNYKQYCMEWSMDPFNTEQ